MRVASNISIAGEAISTSEMDNRYDTVDERDMRTALNRMTSFLASVDQNVDQRRN